MYRCSNYVQIYYLTLSLLAQGFTFIKALDNFTPQILTFIYYFIISWIGLLKILWYP